MIPKANIFSSHWPEIHGISESYRNDFQNFNKKRTEQAIIWVVYFPRSTHTAQFRTHTTGVWKFNKPLLENENYQEQMKTLIKNVLDNLDQDNIVDPQLRW